ncbi:hypothetical protein FRC08_011330 [Ceratobasidium sp. 394]|nr:hypothetical protein FRC08_011330 [Ceratobasidium sp. 394]KAG9082795.1 hypothetical protein FS749_006563 [Ceratobasidium sp. UAMH 11750]
MTRYAGLIGSHTTTPAAWGEDVASGGRATCTSHSGSDDEIDQLADDDETGEPATGDETDELAGDSSDHASDVAGEQDGGGNDFDEDTIDLLRSLANVHHDELRPRIKAWHHRRVDDLTLRYTLHYQEVQRAGWAAADRMFEEEGYPTRGRRTSVDQMRRNMLPPVLQRIEQEQSRAIEDERDLYEDIREYTAQFV